jgi:hypothetical protein
MKLVTDIFGYIFLFIGLTIFACCFPFIWLGCKFLDIEILQENDNQ